MGHLIKNPTRHAGGNDTCGQVCGQASCVVISVRSYQFHARVTESSQCLHPNTNVYSFEVET